MKRLWLIFYSAPLKFTVYAVLLFWIFCFLFKNILLDIVVKAREFQKNIYFCFIDYGKAFDCMDHNKLQNSERDRNTDHLTCLLRNLYAGQEATVRTGHGTTDWFQIGKEVRQGCILSPCLLNFYAEYIMRNPGLDEAHLETTFLREISTTSHMQMTLLL